MERAIGAADPKYVAGSKIICVSSWDNARHSAEIIDRRASKDGIEYYVHYIDLNKRMDEWVSPGRIERLDTEVAPTLKSMMAEKLAPLTIPGTPNSGGQGSCDSKHDTPGTSDRKLTRNFKRRYDEIHNVQKGVDELAPIDQTLEKEHEEKTKIKNIQVVELGKYEMDTWYYSPYPDEYAHEHKLYICEFCLKYVKKRRTIEQHKITCHLKRPPGKEIYRMSAQSDDGSGKATLALFEVDGLLQKLYCQNLCLFAKLFLDHKTLFYDVEAFLFYILTEIDEDGFHLMGYFSKEKLSLEEYNLACILTLPPFQRRGYGRLLITFAYELTKREGKSGTPERPLSDLGKVSFRSYWTRILLSILKDHRGNLSIKDLSTMTAIRTDDIVQTLQSLNLIKYWKGQHILSVTARVVDEHLKNVGPQPTWSIDPAKMNWTPTTYAIKRPR
ncbi:putative MYST-like histone acetyltransferase 1 isoform X1 [Selaginella moellendorffii]|uniref:putative MYST-like histone acetyltransferase 1 isoform X1 n=1 Tax=Selaginella moellendorffii TaxID=88036 RepID=UPI000D1C6D37|nr:putative MYST-like histone acetyltransferase 1 isoform X1 [Selaginella moellendorffii]|eukprot:XP_024529898.1 putative MYST-like histone acetyltransferase 1 isoform X1 [Selaginella moellendorffii]